MAILSPCKYCEDRKEACHVTCERGKAYDLKVAAMNKKKGEYNRSLPSHLSGRKTRHR